MLADVRIEWQASVGLPLAKYVQIFHIDFTNGPPKIFKNLNKFEKFMYILHVAPLEFSRPLYKFSKTSSIYYIFSLNIFFLNFSGPQGKFFESTPHISKLNSKFAAQYMPETLTLAGQGGSQSLKRRISLYKYS